MGERREKTLPGTILRDTREQRPWTFEDYPVETRDATLSTGDYALPAHCTHDPDTDTYHPQYAVERKSGHDFLTALTWERDRFKREIQRAAQWTQPLSVVIETSCQTLLCNRGCMAWRDVHPNQVAGTVASWTSHYNVAFHFAESRQRAQLCTFLLLVRHTLVRQLDDVRSDTNQST
ncbi:MAG: ERCC4 domain-containing protein [Halobacteriales archaeon]